MGQTYNPMRELFQDEEVYAEMFPTYNEILKEKFMYPMSKQDRVSDIKCHIHNHFKRAYLKTQTDKEGKPLFAYICPYCNADRKREKKKNKSVASFG